jgi:hypothetical protein
MAMRVKGMLAATTVLLAATGCTEGRAENGPPVSRNFEVTNFSALEVAGPFDVAVSTGKAPSVRVEGPRKLVEAMEVQVRGDRLEIRSGRRNWFGGMSWNDGSKARVTVTVPALRAAAVAGSGDISVDRVTGDRFSGEIAGSGDIDLAQVAVGELAVDIAGSGSARARGQAKRASYSIAGSGGVDAAELTAVDADAEIAGSGSIRARATGTARASIAGSGDIDITGGARCEQSKNGSGNIRCS